MSEPNLPVDLEAALQQLQSAVDRRVARAQEEAASVAPIADGPAVDERELYELRDRLAAAEAEVERLQEALETANSRRGQALKKVDDATAQVDDLLSLLEPKSEVG